MSKTDSQTILSATALCKQVASGDKTLKILENIDLQVYPGESLAIVGVSGSGKSTLLSLLAGLDVPTSGEVIINGQCLHELDEDGRARVRANYTGFIFQSFHLLPSLTALENVMLPLELNHDPNARSRAQDWLSKVSLSHRLNHYPNQLSGGEQQRVAIARAFVTEPHLLFADEPTGNLDRQTGAHIIDLLFAINQEQGTTLVLVTHDEHLAARCQRSMQLQAEVSSL